MMDSLIENEVPSVYASAHAGHSNLKSKENYVSAKDESTKATNKILANSLSGEESSSFNQLVQTERAKTKDKMDQIKGKENVDPSSKFGLSLELQHLGQNTQPSKSFQIQATTPAQAPQICQLSHSGQTPQIGQFSHSG